MPWNYKVRLGVMMFLQFAIFGMWVNPLVNFLRASGYESGEIALVYSTSGWAAIFTPFFVGLIADRFFASEKILGVLNLLGGALLYLSTLVVVSPAGAKQPWLLFIVMLAHCVCYMPTWSLTSSIALYHAKDVSREFPPIRVMGTIGWIAVSAISLISLRYELEIEKTVWPLWIGSGLAIVTGLYNFFLPHTPPRPPEKYRHLSDILGGKALRLLKEPNFLLFVACSFLIMLPGRFYWIFGNEYLREVGIPAPQFKQSIGQMSELVFMVVLPLCLRRYGVKVVLLTGILAWLARYLLFAFADADHRLWMIYLGIALHGICFAFFFVAGQLYVDRKAPKEAQASAQGLIALVTWGIGDVVGSFVAGAVVDMHKLTDEATGAVSHAWHQLWLWPAAMVAAIAVLFLFFREDAPLREQALK
jgi:nucleoside transporter